MNWIDLRSDTVTLPTPEMRQAMFDAPVGDDVFQEDPTVIALEEKLASAFGKEAGLFCPSGTQTNQIAMMVHLQPGGEVICHEESHIYKYEGGGIARNAGASVRLLTGDRGRITQADIAKWYNNPLDVHLPLTQLVSLEDTANRGGGACYDFDEIKRIKAWCDTHHLPLHLDGARVFNRLVAKPVDWIDYGAQFDSISICLSKGLGAPVGSVLIGSKSFINRARRVRKVLGGGMRQAGILAAAGLYAIEHHVDRLSDDHRRARVIGDALAKQNWIKEVLPVETNIVVAHLDISEQREEVIAYFHEHGIKIMAFGPGMLRFVVHLNVSDSAVDHVISTIEKRTATR